MLEVLLRPSQTRPPSIEPPDVYLVTVHGTNDGDHGASTKKWWEKGSEFVRDVRSEVPADVRMAHWDFRWSGTNQESYRRRASERMARAIVRNAKRCVRPVRYVFVCHSHGANVVRGAMNRMFSRNRSLADRNIASVEVISVGAPFFVFEHYPKGQWSASPPLVLFPLFTSCVVFGVLYAATGWALSSLLQNVHVVLLALCAAGVLLSALLGVAIHLRASLGRLVIGRLAPCDGVRWTAVYSSNDEAIGALHYFSKQRRLLRLWVQSRRRPASSDQVLPGLALNSMISLVLGSVAYLSQVGLLGETRHFGPQAAILLMTLGDWAKWVFSFAATGLFFSERLSTWAWKMADWLAGVADGFAISRISEAVFGSDCSPKIIGVTTTPWPDCGEGLPLDGPLHSHFERHIAESQSDTMRNIRGVLSVDEPTADREFGRFLEAVTWNELAHTAYFNCLPVRNALVMRVQDAIERAHSSSTSPP